MQFIKEFNMPEKSFKKTDSKGREEEWIWDETPEATAAIAQLHETIRLNKISQLELKAPDYGVGK